MSSLQGFEVVSPNTASGRSVLTVTKNYARLNKNAVLELGRPEFIEFFINPTTKQFAFKACEESNPNAIPFFIPGKTTASVTLNQQFVLDAMGPYFEFPEVEDDQEAYAQIKGTLLNSEDMLVFNAAKAEQGVMKKRGRKKGQNVKVSEA